MSPCDCVKPPIISSRERLPGARRVHVTDERGTWCAVAIGLTGPVYRQTIVAPSPEEIARHAEPAPAPRPDPFRLLARAVLDGRASLSAAEESRLRKFIAGEEG